MKPKGAIYSKLNFPDLDTGQKPDYYSQITRKPELPSTTSSMYYEYTKMIIVVIVPALVSTFFNDFNSAVQHSPSVNLQGATV